MANRSYNNGNTDSRFKFTGQELDQELDINLYYFGARYYDPASGRWLSVDPLSHKYPSLSPYAYVGNNPIILLDPDGRYICSVHYKMTNDILQNMGYGKGQSDLISHYSSVYADNPGRPLLAVNNVLASLIDYPSLSYRNDIDYSRTKNSQDTYASYTSSWHAMTSDWEAETGAITQKQAMMRGLAFGWDKVFSSAAKGSLGSLSANSGGMQDLGQGLHALQDAFVHRGTSMSNHSTYDDVFGSQMMARNITRSALIVHQVLNGDFSNVSGGMTLYLNGMSKSQIKQVIDKLKEEGYEVNY